MKTAIALVMLVFSTMISTTSLFADPSHLAMLSDELSRDTHSLLENAQKAIGQNPKPSQKNAYDQFKLFDATATHFAELVHSSTSAGEVANAYTKLEDESYLTRAKFEELFYPVPIHVTLHDKMDRQLEQAERTVDQMAFHLPD